MQIYRKCDICEKEYSHDQKQKSKYCSQSCRSFAYAQRKIKGDENIDYVICKMCNFKFREINNDHINKHNISCDEYDHIYGCGNRTSLSTKNKKDTLTKLMCDDLSIKLSKSQKLIGFIEKYGEVEGHKKYINKIQKMSYSKSIEYYIGKYGKELGNLKFVEMKKSRSISLDKFILKYGEIEGMVRYDKWRQMHKIKNTLSHFISIYGENGIDRWLDKNNNISISNSKIDKTKKTEFASYILEVNKFTRMSLNMNNLFMIEMRGKENGYDLDHLVSKIDGFKNKIPSYIIGHISNLKIVESSYNRKKQHNSDISIVEIIEKYELDDEYKILINSILDNVKYII